MRQIEKAPPSAGKHPGNLSLTPLVPLLRTLTKRRWRPAANFRGITMVPACPPGQTRMHATRARGWVDTGREVFGVKKIKVRKAGPVRLTSAAHALYSVCGKPN